MAVESVERLESRLDVYNVEVHGERVYRVTVDGVLVHNSYLGDSLIANGFLKPAGKGWQAAHIVPKTGFSWMEGKLDHARAIMNNFGLMDDYRNGFWAKQAGGHAGTHTKDFCDRIARAFKGVNTKAEAEIALATLWNEIKVGTYWN